VRLAGDDGWLVAGLRPRQLGGPVLVATDDDGGEPVAELAGEIPVSPGKHLRQRMTLSHQRPQRVPDQRCVNERLAAMPRPVAAGDGCALTVDDELRFVCDPAPVVAPAVAAPACVERPALRL